MKKVLSLVLALALVLGSFAPAFAAENPYAEQGTLLEELGVFKGADASVIGDVDFDATITRSELFILVSRLMTEVDVQADDTSKVIGATMFNDVELTDWFAGPAGWAFAKDLTKGVGNDNFGGNMTVDLQQVQTLLLRALGNTGDDVWANAAELADAAGIMEGITEEGTVTKGLLAALTVNTLKAEKTDGTVLADALNIDLGEEEEPVEEALAVESITATNLKEIAVVFNKAVDEDTIVKGNFLIGDGTNDTTPVLGEDGKTVTVTINDTDITGALPTTYALTIENVTDVDGNEIAKVEKSVKVYDREQPVVESVTLIGPKQFKINFSEPMNTVGEVKLNNGIYYVTAPVTVSSDSVTIDISASSLPEGDYEVKVNDFVDYAGWKIDETVLTLTYVEDTTLPTATIKSATQTSVVVEFDKAVTLDATSSYVDYFYHTFNTWKPDTVTSESGTVTDTTWTLDFTTYPIPEGTSTLVVKYKGSVADSEVVDAWGNELEENINLAVTVEADDVAPAVTEVEYVKENEIKIYFSEDMDEALVEDEDNFTVKDSVGDEVTTAFTNTYSENAADDEYYVTMAFVAKLDGGNYTVDLTGLEDEALNANPLSDITLAFTVIDKTAIDPILNADDVKVTAVPGATDADDEIFYVTYVEKMAVEGENSVLRAENYLLDGVALHEDATLELFGSTGKVVKITVPHYAALDLVDGGDGYTQLTIGRVADAAGNKITAFSFAEDVTAELAPVVTLVKQIDYNKITIVIDKPLKAVDTAGFTTDLLGNNKLAGINSWEINDSNETLITATVQAVDVASSVYTDQLLANLDVVADVLIAETGMKMATNDISGLIEDYRAPKLVDTNAVIAGAAAGTIEIRFTENLDDSVAGLVAQDLVIVDADGNTLVAGLDYTTTIAPASNMITVNGLTSGADYTIKSKDSITYIRDLAAGVNNKAEAFAEEVELTLN